VPLNPNTISRYESGKVVAQSGTLEQIESALKAEGINFIEKNGGGPGVRLKA